MLALLFLMPGTLACLPHGVLPAEEQLPAPPLVIAHRGASGDAPENTLAAFELALERGAHILEMDLQLTADGHLVVIHDATVDRTTDGTGRVSELSLADLRRLDAGYRFMRADEAGREGTFPFRGSSLAILTLSEVLAAFPDARMILEMKPESPPVIVDALVKVLQAFEGGDNLIIASFHSGYLRRFREQMPDMATAFSVRETGIFYLMQVFGLTRWYRPAGDVLIVPEYSRGIHVLTPGFVRAARRLDLDVYVWTLNAPEDIQRVLGLGVAGIITDYPGASAELSGFTAPAESPVH